MVKSAAPIIIAIDGPGASGKSTTARALAAALGFVYVDTGAMYRTLAWHCLQLKVELGSAKAVAATCRRWRTRLHLAANEPDEIRLLVNGYWPGAEIRTREVTAAASRVAVVPPVRLWMKRVQRHCAEFGNLVMEGRDISTHVFPETDHKFWLDATAAERARRRTAQGVDDDLPARDRRDSQRAAAPLMMGLGSVRIDTTGRQPKEIVAEILAHLRARIGGSGSTLGADIA